VGKVGDNAKEVQVYRHAGGEVGLRVLVSEDWLSPACVSLTGSVERNGLSRLAGAQEAVVLQHRNYDCLSITERL